MSDPEDDRISFHRSREPKRDRDGLTKCRICGCTEREACNPPCSWVAIALCSGCADAARAIREWQEGARSANMTALMREVEQWREMGVMDCAARRNRRRHR